MRIKKKYIFLTLVLAGFATLCIVRWHAWFDMPPEPEWDGPQRDYVFPMFDKDKTPKSFDMLVLGDIHNNLTKADYNLLAKRVPQTDVILQTGDWLAWGQNYYYQSLLQEWLYCNLYGTPVIATPGNHEYNKGLIKSRSEVWNHAFRYLDNGPKGVPGATYYIDLPQIRLICFDTNPLWRVMHYTRTLTWLHQTMDSAGDRYVIVMMHHPVISAAKRRFNPTLYAMFRHVLGYADLVLSGHDHSYMRRTPFVILNTGGTPKKQRGGLHAQVTDTVPVYSVISVTPSQADDQIAPLSFKSYRLSDGVLIDSLYVTHD